MIAILLASMGAEASTFSEVPSVATLTEEAKSIVQGEVLQVRTTPCSLGLCTMHTILVQQVIKGNPTDTVEVKVPGGRWNGLTQRVSGIPLWDEGDHVLVFIDANQQARLTGLWTVADDGRTLDPLKRPSIPSTVADLADFIRERHPGTHD